MLNLVLNSVLLITHTTIALKFDSKPNLFDYNNFHCYTTIIIEMIIIIHAADASVHVLCTKKKTNEMRKQ